MKINNFWWGIIIGFGICLFFLGSYILNIFNIPGPGHYDVYLISFILKHWMHVFATFDFGSASTLPMFYGFKNSLFFSDPYIIQAIMGFPAYLLTGNIIFTFNFLVVISLILSFFSMYILCWHFTKNMLASLIGSVIFCFNPYVFSHFPDHLMLLSLMWIPLIFLFLERSLEKPKSYSSLFLCLSLICQILSSLYYAAFLTIILPIYVVFRIRQTKTSVLSIIKSRSFLVSIVIFVVIILPLGFIYKNALTSQHIAQRQLAEADQYFSAWPSDFLFANGNNLVYGGLRTSLFPVFSNFFSSNDANNAERNLFLGLIPITILIISFFRIKKENKSLYFLWLFLLILSLVLSFGPNIHLTQDLTIPNLYLIFYKVDPVLTFIRSISRFAVFVFFFLALICSVTLKNLSFNSSFGKNLGIFLLVLLILEFWNRPISYMNITAQTQNFYKTLDKNKNIKVVVELPIGNSIPSELPGFGNYSRPPLLDSNYLLYGSLYHSKTLLNGYSGYFPVEYYQKAGTLDLQFPTRYTLDLLRSWGVDGVILDRDEYNFVSDFYLTRKTLEDLKIPVVAQAPSLVLFDLTHQNWK